MKLISWLKNRKDYKNGKKLTLSNITNYLEAEFNHWRATSDFLSCPDHIKEQSVWRLSKVQEYSPKCLTENKCVNCGCDVVEETFGSQGCNYGCYPALMNVEEWNQYKKNNKLTVQC